MAVRAKKPKRRPNRSNPVPYEHEEQVALFRWSDDLTPFYPDLGMMYANQNAGKRTPAERRVLREGLKSGVPDICLPVARFWVPQRGPMKGQWVESHSLYIELKRTKGGKVSPEQREWIKKLRAQGHWVEVCRGAVEAIEIIKEYLGLPDGV